MKNLKKLLVVFFFTVVVMAFALPYTASAEIVEYGDITFDTETGTIIRVDYDCNDELLDIPSEINGVTVRAIDDYAISETRIKTINIPSTVEYIGGGLSFRNYDLKAIYVDDDNPYYCDIDGVLYNKDVTALIACPYKNNSAMASLPKTVTRIGDGAIYYLTNIDTFDISNVISLGNSAITGLQCNRLIVNSELLEHGEDPIDEYWDDAAFTFIDHVYFIGESAFLWDEILEPYCSNFTYNYDGVFTGEYAIGDGYIYFNQAGTVTGIKNVRNLDIPEEINGTKIVAIADKAFAEYIGYQGEYEYYSFNRVTIPGTVKKIGNYAFYRAEIKELVLSDGVEIIGDYAFSAEFGSKTLKELTIPDSVTYIGESAFGYNNGLTSLTIPGSVKTIGRVAFSECMNIKTLTLEEGIETIGDYAFCYNNITELVIPDSVKTIGAHAFEMCGDLEKVTIGEGVESIGDYAFCDTAIKTIDIPASVEDIGKLVFDFTPLVSIEVHEDNTSYTSVDGVLFTRDMKELVYYPLGKKDVVYIIPESVVKLSDGVFRYMPNLREIVVSENLVEFDADDFSIPYYKDRINTVYYTCTQQEWESIERGDFGEHVTTHVFGYPCSVNGHVFGEWMEETAPTCAAAGSEYRACSYCDEREVRKTEPIPHTYGDWVIITPATGDNEGIKKCVCTVCGFSKNECIPKLEKEKKFIDVQDGKWYTEAIYYCYGNDYMAGVSEDTFGYKDTVTRAMFVTILAKIDGAELSEYTEMSFIDVKADQWYSASIEWAYKNGYASGIGDGAFGYKNDVTREQIAMFFYTYSEKNGIDVSGRAEISGFADYDRIHEYALDAMSWAVAAELISGTSETTLSPRDTATRAEIAVMIMKYAESIK